MNIIKLEKSLITNMLYDDTFIEYGIDYKNTIQVKEDFWVDISEYKYTLYDFYVYNLLQCMSDKNGLIWTTINKITYNKALKILVNNIINIKDKISKIPKEYILRLIPFLDEEELGSLLYIITNYKYSFDLIKIQDMTEKELYRNNPFIKKYENNNCSKARIGKRLGVSEETIRRKLKRLTNDGICIKPNIFVIPSILNRVEYIYNCIICDIENKISKDKIKDVEIISEDTDIKDEEVLYQYCKNAISLYKESLQDNNYDLIKDKLIVFNKSGKVMKINSDIIRNIKSNKRENVPAKLRIKLLNESARWVESEQKYIPSCQFCGKTALETTLHIDHIIPYTKGGKTVEENLQVLCKECNIQKSNKYKLIINKEV